jgi:predicted alpha/beta hydrolase family esterase
MREELHVGPDTILVGHSSGAVAAMRLAEETVVGGLVLVSACHSDLGDEGERASGYYPPSGGPWNWEAIRKNCSWIVQFHSKDDPLVPAEEGRLVAKELKSEYTELDGHSHFFEPFRELLDAIIAKAK